MVFCVQILQDHPVYRSAEAINFLALPDRDPRSECLPVHPGDPYIRRAGSDFSPLSVRSTLHCSVLTHFFVLLCFFLVPRGELFLADKEIDELDDEDCAGWITFLFQNWRVIHPIIIIIIIWQRIFLLLWRWRRCGRRSDSRVGPSVGRPRNSILEVKS